MLIDQFLTDEAASRAEAWLSGNAPPIDTVLCGAGISMGPPTCAPSGEQLAAYGVRALLQSLGLSARTIDVACARIEPARVRLETIMQTWHDHSHTRSLAAAYTSVGGLPPNPTHQLLAARRQLRILTLNMDTCIEAAAGDDVPVHVTHLHGVWHDADSIVTTIEDSVRGPSAAALASLRKAGTRRHVLVLGYSGRDEVLGLLIDTGPASITWVQYDASEDLWPEAAASLREAERRGIPVWVHTGASEPFLCSLPFGRLSTDAPVPSPPPPPPETTELVTSLRSTPYARRRLAAAAILGDLFMWREAAALLQPLVADGDVEAAKLSGRFLRQDDQPRAALHRMGWPPVTPRRAHTLLHCANEVLAAGKSARSVPLLLLDMVVATAPAQVWRSPRARRLADGSRTRTADFLAMRGFSRQAQRLLERAPLALREAAGSYVLDTHDTSSLADALKSQGRYREALAVLDETPPNPALLGARFHGEFVWRRLEILVLLGRNDEAAEAGDWLSELVSLSAAGGSPLGDDACTWFVSTIAYYRAAVGDLDGAAGIAGQLPRDRGQVSTSARAYAALMRAELALAAGDGDAASHWVGAAGRALREHRGLWSLPTYSLAVRYERARLRTAVEPRGGARDLHVVARGFDRWHLPSMALRCRALAWAAEGVTPPAALVHRARDRHWKAESALLAGAATDVPMLVVV
ncbi:hypothetical protein [Cellulomonas sp. PSBB021]|uniref:hypothetical protein n=1 Tax=Cellulomonas sp. PSBB021 TaxID=2003551 RepID=UPI000B8D619E|nr:hypothetical protein [Cellulomonas sp. PSBB021]ASR55716.1 hypothetical protein CBP52_12135 [Cellulomonas sp. PSBB021]